MKTIISTPQTPSFHRLCQAVETKTGSQLAVKIVEKWEENLAEVLGELRVLREHSLHPNIPHLQAAYRCTAVHYLLLLIFYLNRCNGSVWFCMELCSNGAVSELSTALVRQGRRLNEDQVEHSIQQVQADLSVQVGYIVKEVLHALVYLQQHGVVHRDVKGSNILLTESCEVNTFSLI